MNLLICTSIDTSEKCAAVNRLNRLITALKPFGVKSIICYSDKSLPQDTQHTFREGKITFPLFVPKLLPRAYALNKGCAQFYSKNLQNILNFYNIDIILVYSTFSTLLDPIIRIGKLASTPVVADGGELFSISLQNLLNGVNFMQIFARVHTFKRLSGLSCCSFSQLKYSQKNLIPSVFFPGLMPYIPNANVDIQSNSSELNIVTISSFHPRENLSYLIKAVKKASALGLPVRLTIVGNTSSNLIQKLTYFRLKRLINNPSLITVTGFISDEKLSSIMNCASAFVLLRKPSNEIANTFPTRIPEYLSYKKPLILCNVKPFTDFFTKDKDSLIISHQRMITELVDAFYFIYYNPHLASSLASCGSSTSNRLFSPDVVGKRVYNFFQELI